MPSRRTLVRALWLLDRSYLPLVERADLEAEVLQLLAVTEWGRNPYGRIRKQWQNVRSIMVVSGPKRS
jgi:hypothetical protein